MAKKGGGTQTVAQTPDAATAGYQQQVRDAAQGAAGQPGPGLSPETQSAIDMFGQYMRGGNLGFSAMNGDPTAMASYMNPYQSNVIDATKAQFGDLRDATTRDINDQATQAGAFGGSRAAIAQGAALGELGRGEQTTLAGLNKSGYDDAMTRAGAAANLGFGASGAMAGLGDYTRSVGMDQNPALWRLKMLSQVPFGNTGSTQTTTGTQGHNGASGLLGGAATGAEIGSMFPGWGTAIGTGLGGLFGMFS